MSGARATPAATWATAASPAGRPRASCSAASGCPKCAATSVSAGPSATGCSWPRASRSTPSTPRCKARDRPRRRSAQFLLRRPEAFDEPVDEARRIAEQRLLTGQLLLELAERADEGTALGER